MDIGLVYIPTDRSAPIAELAKEAEQRGLASLYVGGDHTHIPTSRQTPFPGGGDLPDEYRRSLDPIVALTVAAMSTTTLHLGTAVYLLAQRDAIDTAKKVATLDHVAPGRLHLGVGYGWNAEEAADHGVEWAGRRDLVREQVLAMKSLWTDDEATFRGNEVNFAPSWMWPKPTTSPPVLVGASPGPRTFASIVEWADGWLPVPFWGHSPAHLDELRRRARDAGRNPDELEIVVDGVLADPAMLDPWAEARADSALVALPSLDLDDLRPILDAAADLIDRYR